MKAICIKSKIFDFGSSYGGTQFKVEKGKVYEYIKDNFGFNIQDEDRRNLYYTIINFHEFFIDIIEYREQKINKILN
jgi:hypothetical protein